MSAGIPGTQSIRLRKNNGVNATPKIPVAPEAPKLVKSPNDMPKHLSARWEPSGLTVFRILVLVRALGAMYSGISDCDEVFNYWEPLHYLVRGKGFQTWEYSPDYSIRSWFYILIHALPAFIGKAIQDKRFSFFFLRIVFGIISSATESYFYSVVATYISAHVGRYLIAIFLVAPGFFTSATSFLPSTFAMWGVMLAMSFALQPVDNDWKRISKIGLSFGIAAIVGWPFVAILAIPAIVEQLFLVGSTPMAERTSAAWSSKRAQNLFIAGVVALSPLILVVGVDSLAYQKLTIVPYNIVKYNILPSSSEIGPTLYGTESSSYYFKNGLLGFNFIFIYALASLPVLLLTSIIDPNRFGELRDRVKGTTSPYISLTVRLSPLYLWLAIITLQAHKEERFMYPVYPLIAFNGAVSIYLMRGWLEKSYLTYTQSPYRTKKSGLFSLFTQCVLVLFALISYSRITALFHYYRAPQNIFYNFQSYELPRLAVSTFPQLYTEWDATAPREVFVKSLQDSETVINLQPLGDLNLRLCLGKEWHRFGSHFLVPDQVEVRFIQSAFTGILPKVWETQGNGLFGRATADVPTNMNNQNREEIERYVPLDTCHYLIDVDYPHRARLVDKQEPRYAEDVGTWTKVHCHPFLDAQESSPVTRILYFKSKRWQELNKFGDYCLLRNKKLLKLLP